MDRAQVFAISQLGPLGEKQTNSFQRRDDGNNTRRMKEQLYALNYASITFQFSTANWQALIIN